MATFESTLFDVFEESEPPKKKRAKETDSSDNEEGTTVKESAGTPTDLVEVDDDLDNDNDLQEIDEDQRLA
jgi:hypothetical protein